MISFEAYIPEKKILRVYINMLNGVFELTNRERDILSLLFELDLNWTNDRPKNIIDMNSRRYIMQNTFINKNNLSKYISKFKNKRILTEYEKGRWVIDENIIPSTLIDNKEVNIRFTLKTE